MANQQDFRVKKGIVVSEAANVVGNTAIGGTLAVTGTTALSSTLGVTGATTLSNTLGVAGATTLSSTLGVTGATTLSNTVNVTGATTLANTLGVTGAATLSSTLGVVGATTLSGTAGVTGAATLANTLNVTGATTLSNTLAVTGTSTFNNTVSIGANVVVTTSSISIGNSTVNTGITPLAITGNSTAALGNTTITGWANVVGNTQITNTLNANNVNITGNLTVTGTTTYVNSTNLNVGDNIITLNADLGAVAPSENAGIEVNRGTSANSSLFWNEAADRWDATGNTALAGAVGEIHIGGTGVANSTTSLAGGSVVTGITINNDGFGHLRGWSVASANLDARYLGFSAVAKSGQTTVVADAYNDTLTFANNAGIDITTDAVNDIVTFGHSDTSAQSNVMVDNTDGTVLQDITLNFDTFGHVVGVGVTSANLDTRYSQLSFTNIVAGNTSQANVVADSISDTLTFANTAGVDITTNALTDTITIGHTDTSSVSNLSSDNAGGTLLQDISFTFDTFGHVTGASVSTANLDLRYPQTAFTNIVAGNTSQANVVSDAINDTLTFANSAGIDITTNALTDTITFAHTDTSSVGNLSSDNAGGTVLQDVSFTFDTFGHVTGASVSTVNLDTRYLGFPTIVAGNTSQANVVADLYNDTLTFANSAGIDITTNATTDTITFAHADTSAVGNLSSDNSNGTVLQDISLTFDTFGHVTGATAATANLDTRYLGFATVTAGATALVADAYNDTLTVAAGGGIVVTGDAATDTMTISHSDTSSASNLASDNSNGIVVQDISFTFDTYGHVTAASVGTADLDTRYDTRYAGFQNIQVSGQANVVADAYNDILTFVGAGGISITTNATTDTITFTAPTPSTANTTSAGIVQLVDSISNTSVVVAPTANAVKSAYDAAAALAANGSYISTGTVAVARGGTGVGTLTGIVYGNGTSAFTAATAAQIVSAIGTTNVANASYATSAGSAGSAGTATNQSGGTVNATTGAFSGAVSTGALTVTGAITATGDITAYYSDNRLKTRLGNIENALDAVTSLNGFRYTNNELANQLGYTSTDVQVGVSAQEVENVLPEIVTLAPFDMQTDDEGNITSKSGESYKTVSYAKLVPLLIEAIKELKAEVDELKGKLNGN